MVELKGWKRTAAYSALFAVAFLVALRQTFPAEAVLERLVLEGAAQGWQVKAAKSGPGGVLGVRFTGLMLESREGARVPVDELRASVRLWPLLLGRRGLDLDARLFDGRVKGMVEEGRSVRRLAATVEGVNLSKAAALRRAAGFDLGGIVQGTVDLSLDGRDQAQSSGSLDLRIEKAALMGGQVELAALGGSLTLPRADLGTVAAHAVVKEGKAAFDKLEARSPDLELVGEGVTVGLQPRLAYSTLFGKLRLRLQESFWQKSGTGTLRGVAEVSLAPARGKDGSFWFQVFGTLSQPQARPAPQ